MENNNSFFKGFSLLKINLVPLLLFEFLYEAFGTYILFPFCVSSIRNFIISLGGTLITADNFRLLYENPEGILILVLLALILILYFLFEISTLMVGLKAGVNGIKLNFFSLIIESLQNFVRFLQFKNWSSFLLIVLFIPFLRIGLQSGISEILYADSFLQLYTDFIISKSLIISLVIVYLILFFMFALVFVFFTQYDTNMITAIYLNFKVYKEYFFKTIKDIISVILKTLLFILLISVLFFAAVLTIFIFINYIYSENGTVATDTFQVYRSLVDTTSPVFAAYFMFTSVTGPLIFFSGLYSIYFESSKKVTKKRKLAGALSSLILIISFISYSLFQGSIIASNVTDDAILIAQNGAILTGHRGNVAEECDNTAASFVNAINNGAQYIELDVVRTLDNVIVVSHSNDMSWYAGHEFNISEHNYEDLFQFEIYDPAKNCTPGQHILALDEVLDLVKGNAKINLEIKNMGNKSDNYVQEVIDAVKRHDMLDQVFIASENYLYITQAEDIDENVKTLFLTDSNYGDIENLRCDSLSIEYHAIDSETVRRIHQKGKTIHAWTLEDEATISDMIDLGVDYLIVNNVKFGANSLANNKPDYNEQIKKLFSDIILET